MKDFLSALALLLVFEGLAYAAFGTTLKKNIGRLLALPVSTLRAARLVAAAVGLVLLWVIRS